MTNKNEAILASPPMGVAGLSVMGIPLAEWVYILTIVYTIFLIIDKLPVVHQRFIQLWSLIVGRRTQKKEATNDG